MKKIIQPVKGTRDFYPDTMAMRTWLYSKVRKVSVLFGYQEYEGPFLESIDLYAAKSGDELVKEQSFVFPDRSGDLITLRPELTPTLARMVAQKQNRLIYPLRWWSYGPFWRYERPQKGRTREFFQWNIDLIGVNSSEADAELIAIIATFFKEISLSSHQVKILINDRQLIETALKQIGITESNYQEIFRLIDRKEKMSPESWISYGHEIGLSDHQMNNISRMLADDLLWQKSTNLQKVFSALDDYGVAEYIKYDANIIRGLDYYTGTVFEAKEIEGEVKRSILGGGRYDNLLAAVGGNPLPAVGFAMGDVVISLILENNNIFSKNVVTPSAKVVVTVFDAQHLKESILFSQLLRQNNINSICYPEIIPITKQFKYANKIGAKLAIIIGPEEISTETVAVKELETGIQKSIQRNEVLIHISRLLDNQLAS